MQKNQSLKFGIRLLQLNINFIEPKIVIEHQFQNATPHHTNSELKYNKPSNVAKISYKSIPNELKIMISRTIEMSKHKHDHYIQKL